MKEVIRTTCSYCSVGCNFKATIEDGNITSYMPDKDYPVNQGKSCPKGFLLPQAHAADDRLKSPMVRQDDGGYKPVSWDEAIDLFVGKFRSIKETYGPEAAAFISTGQIPLEEMAFLGALFKFGMGFVHADGNTRQCMATAAVAYKQAFGFDAPPFSYEDFETSDLLIFIGANPAIAHPIMWERVKKNKNSPAILVIDPRKTMTARAGIHIPIRPKTDLVLLYGITRYVITRGWIDHKYIDRSTEGFEELKRHVEPFTLEAVSNETGIPISTIEDIAERIHKAKAASLWWTMGINQSHQGVRTAQAIINLCLITGHIGRPGTGPNSITGQANAMGSRLFSNTTSMFSLYDFEDGEDRVQMADTLNIPVDSIPRINSMPYHRILDAVEEGKIKALWIIATNPFHSWINKEHAMKALENLDFLVVQDLYSTTDTAKHADLLLAAAASTEKEGTFINSERRIGIVQKLTEPPGSAKSDFEIFQSIAERWGCTGMFKEWTSPEAVFKVLQRTTKGRPCDITGITGYEMLRSRGGIQWPYPAGNPDDREHRRLFEDGRFFTATGKAKLLTDPVAPPPEEPDEAYPFHLLTGRGTVAQFHTQTRTGKVEKLRKLSPNDLTVQIAPADAEMLGVTDGEKVTVVSRRGKASAIAAVTDEVRRGQVFMPMHYFDTNRLTYPVFDPYSHQPGYKYAAVRVERG